MGNTLNRNLGFFSVSAIIIADMIGTGIFTTSGLVMEQVSNPLLMIVLWVAGGVVALSGALCYAELSTAMPYAGGEYLYLNRLFHPSLGFLSGWISFIVGFSAPLAAVAIGMSEYMIQAFPSLSFPGSIMGLSSALFVKKAIALAVILIFTLVHLQNVKTRTGTHNLFTILKIVMILVLVVTGFVLGDGSFSHFTPVDSEFLSFENSQAIGLSVMWILFAYTGWNAASYIGSEVKDPEKNLPRALIFSTLWVIVLYVLINLIFVFALKPHEMEGVVPIGGLAVKNLFGNNFGRIFSLIIAFVLLSTISSLIMLGPRVYYAMAENGHFFKFASRLNSNGVPLYSVLVQGLVAVMIALFGAFDQILTFMGLTLSIFPVLAVVGSFKLHKRRETVYRSPLYPFFPVFFIFVNVLIIILAVLQRPMESVFALGTIVAGVPLYLVFRKKGKNKS